MGSFWSQTNLSDNLLHAEIRTDQESSYETCEEDPVEGEEESPPHRMTIDDEQLCQSLIEGDVEYVSSLQSEDLHKLDGVTPGGNTVLHIAATSSRDLTAFAKAVYDKNRSLLIKPNKLKETPFHCAAKARNYTMVKKLIELLQPRAHVQNGEGSCPEPDTHEQSTEGLILKTLLTVRNMHGETALHEAVRIGHEDMVQKLIDSELSLAGIVDAQGVSPLYLASMTNALNIVEIFTRKYKSMVSMVSFAGPKRQTALHAAAVLEQKGITLALLKWNKPLATKVDNWKSTPLHYAASVGNLAIVEVLLEYEKSAAYMADKDGLFPIHIAAKCGRALIIKELIKQIPHSDELLDREGRNFLHLAIVSGKGNIIRSISDNCTFLRMLNARDYQGNTPLHLASEVGDFRSVRFLILFKEVCPNIMNNKGLTPVDLAMKNTEQGFMHRLHVQYNLLRLLMWAEGLPSAHRLDRVTVDLGLPKYDKDREIKNAESVTRNLAIISVLTATVTFAASFTMPGGYRSDADQHRGTPILSRHYLFKAFAVANAMAFVLSILATSWLTYSGSNNVDFKLRMTCLIFSIQMVKIATKATVCAFALAISSVLYQVNMALTILICVVTFVVLVFSNPSFAVFSLARPIWKRRGWKALKSVNPLTRERVDVGLGHKFSYMFFEVNVGVGQKFSDMILSRIFLNSFLLAIIFLLALI